MATNPNIALQGYFPQIKGPAELGLETMKMKALLDEQEMNRQLMAQRSQQMKGAEEELVQKKITTKNMQRSQEAEATLNEAIGANFSEGPDGKTSINSEGVYKHLTQKGFGKEAEEYKKNKLAIDKQASDTHVAQLGEQGKVAETRFRIFGGVLDSPPEMAQQAYANALAEADKAGVGDPDLPEELSAEVGQYILSMGTTADRAARVTAQHAASQEKRAVSAEGRVVETQKLTVAEKESNLAQQEAEKQVSALANAKNQEEYGAALARIPEKDRLKYQVKMPTKEERESLLKSVLTPKEILSEERLTAHDRAMESAARLRVAAAGDDSDIQEVVAGIKRGDIPPNTTYYRNTLAVQAGLTREGFNLTLARQDYNAIQRNLATANGPQVAALRRATQFVIDTIPQLEDAYDLWKEKAGSFNIKVFNKANLFASKNLGGEAGSAATQLDGLVSDMVFELATAYKGGGQSTDKSLEIALHNLEANWNEKTFEDALARIKISMEIRRNSVLNPALGVSPNTLYQQPGTAGQRMRAKGPNNHMIYSTDGGNTWFDEQTNQPVR